MQTIFKLAVFLAAAMIAAPPSSQAMPAAPQQPVPHAVQLAQRDGPSLSEAVESVRRQYRGRIVSAETKRRGNREMHVIKVLTDDGKVKTIRIPGRSLGSRG